MKSSLYIYVRISQFTNLSANKKILFQENHRYMPTKINKFTLVESKK